MRSDPNGKVRRFLSQPFKQSIKKALERAENALRHVRADEHLIDLPDPTSVAMLEESVERYQALLDQEPAEDRS